MPIDVYIPKDSLAAGTAGKRVSELTQSLLKWTDATDDEAIRANVGVYIHELPASAVNAAGKPAHLARVDVKLPNVALTTQDRRQGFTADATASVRAAARPDQPFEHVWLIITHAIEGGWGIDGRAFTTEDF